MTSVRRQSSVRKVNTVANETKKATSASEVVSMNRVPRTETAGDHESVVVKTDDAQHYATTNASPMLIALSISTAALEQTIIHVDQAVLDSLVPLVAIVMGHTSAAVGSVCVRYPALINATRIQAVLTAHIAVINVSRTKQASVSRAV